MEFIDIIKLTLFIFVILVTSLVIISYSSFKIKNGFKSKMDIQDDQKDKIKEDEKQEDTKSVKITAEKHSGFNPVHSSHHKNEMQQTSDIINKGINIYNYYSMNKGEKLHKLKLSKYY